MISVLCVVRISALLLPVTSAGSRACVEFVHPRFYGGHLDKETCECNFLCYRLDVSSVKSRNDASFGVSATFCCSICCRLSHCHFDGTSGDMERAFPWPIYNLMLSVHVTDGQPSAAAWFMKPHLCFESREVRHSMWVKSQLSTHPIMPLSHVMLTIVSSYSAGLAFDSKARHRRFGLRRVGFAKSSVLTLTLWRRSVSVLYKDSVRTAL
jgi:hypothetical protein